jgi:hypothetical protein
MTQAAWCAKYGSKAVQLVFRVRSAAFWRPNMFSRGLLPPGVAITAASTAPRHQQSEPRRYGQLFDAAWSSVIEVLAPAPSVEKGF